jgi:hypothetical protein
MANETISIGKQAVQLGIQLTVLMQESGVDAPLAHRWREATANEKKIGQYAESCFQISASQGDISGKVILATHTRYRKPPYDDTDESYKLTEEEISEIIKRGLSPDASAEDKRNLGLCYHCNFIAPSKESHAYVFIINAATKGDDYAAYYFLEYISHGLFLKNQEKINSKICQLGIKSGSLIALLYFIQFIDTKDRQKYCELHENLLEKRKEMLSNAFTRIKNLSTAPNLALKELVLCASNTPFNTPLEVINIIESYKRGSVINGATIQNYIESLSLFADRNRLQKPTTASPYSSSNSNNNTAPITNKPH